MSQVVAPLLGAALRLLAGTWRVEGMDELRAELHKWRDRPLLVGFWHGQYFALLVLSRGIHARIFVGEGRRGTRIAAISRSFGLVPVVLPHRDRERAIESMRTALIGSLPCASALDGPLGPAHRVKPALLQLASELGATILPISISTRPRFVLRWRWDRREVPLPFANVKVRVASAIQAPLGASHQQQAGLGEEVALAIADLE